jgi:hypothetical protein
VAVMFGFVLRRLVDPELARRVDVTRASHTPRPVACR